MVETPKVPANSYGAFATDDTCGAIHFDGNVTINSYDSTRLSRGATDRRCEQRRRRWHERQPLDRRQRGRGGQPVHAAHRRGRLRGGRGERLDRDGHADVAGSVVQLPTDVTYPPPPVPAYNTMPLADHQLRRGRMRALGLTLPTAPCSGYDVMIDGHGATLSLPSVTLTGQTNIVLVATTPSRSTTSTASRWPAVDRERKATIPTQGVLVNVVGKNTDGTDIAMPIDFVGRLFRRGERLRRCSNYDASILQFVYGGTGEIKMKGNSGAAATFYAPNAQWNSAGLGSLRVDTGEAHQQPAPAISITIAGFSTISGSPDIPW